MRTPEQIEADAALEAAIRRCAEAYFGETKREKDRHTFLTDWIVVVSHADLGDDDGGKSLYGVLMPNGGIPTHHAVGLLDVGKEQLLHPDDWEDDDPDSS